MAGQGARQGTREDRQGFGDPQGGEKPVDQKGKDGDASAGEKGTERGMCQEREADTSAQGAQREYLAP
jgi:hypothetical protein